MTLDEKREKLEALQLKARACLLAHRLRLILERDHQHPVGGLALIADATAKTIAVTLRTSRKMREIATQ